MVSQFPVPRSQLRIAHWTRVVRGQQITTCFAGDEETLSTHSDTFSSVESNALKLEVIRLTKLRMPRWDPVIASIEKASKGNLQLLWIGDATILPFPIEKLCRLSRLDNLQHLVVLACINHTGDSREADNWFRETLIASQRKSVPLTSLAIKAWIGDPLTLASLYHVSLHAKSLTTLRLSINSSFRCDVFPPSLLPPDIPPSCKEPSCLQNLYLDDTRAERFPVDSHWDYALFLDRLFPDLPKVTVDEPRKSDVADSVKEGWSIIEQLRKDYQFHRRSS
ncbi:hypothetical protein CC2G_014519 [Coprinopsis cinerea AmutBmut pab1-1]|nr:hypothetical protein CC2G_014519 [Coprinopsis cinerea AmutBmut pab1-1]